MTRVVVKTSPDNLSWCPSQYTVDCLNTALSPEDKPGKRIPKAGVYAEAGVGQACAEYSVFEAEAKGPNASAGAEISVGGAGAMARAEIAMGLGLDTGASIGVGGVEAKFLGTGFSVGPKTSVSVLGSEVSCSVM
uniref:Uncharacterized protein n=1 Tax=Cyprinus carpio TaxID=7962 RepID=A0A8C2H7X8_CYPCA